MCSNIFEDIKELFEERDYYYFEGWELSSLLYDLVDRENYDTVLKCKEYVLGKWRTLIELYVFDVWIEEITSIIAEKLELVGPEPDAPEEMCNIAVEVQEKDVLKFLWKEGYKSYVEIPIAAYNCDSDFLDWMYREEKIPWGKNIDFSFEYIKSDDVIKFMEKNMENWKNGKFPCLSVKKAIRSE